MSAVFAVVDRDGKIVNGTIWPRKVDAAAELARMVRAPERIDEAEQILVEHEIRVFDYDPISFGVPRERRDEQEEA